MEKSNEGAIGTLIRAAMTASANDGTRQRDLVLALFDAPQYGVTSIKRFFEVKGADRADLIGKALADLSPTYSDTASQLAKLKDMAKDMKDNPTAKGNLLLQAEGLTSKVRAANVLFTRALQCVFHLHTVKAESINASKATPGAISFVMPDPDHKGPEAKRAKVRVNLSINSLTRAGTADVDKAVGKVRETRKANAAGTGNDIGRRGVAMSAGLVSTFLQQNAKPLEDYADDEEEALNTLLDRLIVAKFASDGRIDAADVVEYVKSIKIAATKPLQTPGDKAAVKPEAKKAAAKSAPRSASVAKKAA